MGKHAAGARETWGLAQAPQQASLSRSCVLRSCLSSEGARARGCKLGQQVHPVSSPQHVRGCLLDLAVTPPEGGHPTQLPALSGHPLCSEQSKYVCFYSGQINRVNKKREGTEEDSIVTKIRSAQSYGAFTVCRAWLEALPSPINRVLLNTPFTDKEAEALKGHRTKRWQSQDSHPGQAP